MKTKTTKSETRKAGEPHCGCPACARKPTTGSWYCWKHATEDLCDWAAYTMDAAPMMAAA